ERKMGPKACASPQVIMQRAGPSSSNDFNQFEFLHRTGWSKTSYSASSAAAVSTETHSMPGLASTHHRAGSDVLRESGNASPEGYGRRIVFKTSCVLRFPRSLHFEN